MASLNDLFTDSENGGPPVPTTVSATRSPGSTTLNCNALLDWPTNTAVHFVTGTATVDAEGNPIIDPATLCLWKGVVSGTTIVNLTLRGAPSFPTDPGNNINDIVQMAPTSSWEHDFFEGATKDHDTQGGHLTLHDVNGNTWIGQIAAANAVNFLQVTNAATGGTVIIGAAGTDTNISLNLVPKGTGTVQNNGSGIPQTASVVATETTTSTSYVDLATVTDTVTVTIGGSGCALVSCGGTINNNGANDGESNISFAASGANTIAAGVYFQQTQQVSSFQNHENTAYSSFFLIGLSPGVTTFKMKYKVNSGTGIFSNRRIAVVPI